MSHSQTRTQFTKVTDVALLSSQARLALATLDALEYLSNEPGLRSFSQSLIHRRTQDLLDEPVDPMAFRQNIVRLVQKGFIIRVVDQNNYAYSLGNIKSAHKQLVRDFQWARAEQEELPAVKVMVGSQQVLVRTHKNNLLVLKTLEKLAPQLLGRKFNTGLIKYFDHQDNQITVADTLINELGLTDLIKESPLLIATQHDYSKAVVVFNGQGPKFNGHKLQVSQSFLKSRSVDIEFVTAVMSPTHAGRIIGKLGLGGKIWIAKAPQQMITINKI